MMKLIYRINKPWTGALLMASLFIMLTLFAGNAIAFSSGGCDGDCNKCHALNKKEAGEIIKKRIPDAKVLNLKMSPVKGLWEVYVQSKGKDGLLYVDFSKKYIIQGPIVDASTGTDKTNERYQKEQQNKKIDVSRIPLKNALVLGDKSAKKKVIIFTDPDCPFCAKLHDEMKRVLEKRKDIVFYIKLFPLKMHPDSYWKAKSIICNKSIQMLDDNFAKKPITRTECNSKEVDNTIKLAVSLGITGTPTIILPNGKMHSGAMPADQLIEFIDGKIK